MYEYEVIPAPRKGKKSRGVRSSEGRFANAMTALLNDMAAEGWEYLRADTLPSEERSGLRGRSTVYQNMLVFRRFVGTDEAEDLVDEQVEDTQASPTAPAMEYVTDPFGDNTAPSLPSAAEANEPSDTAPQIERRDD